MESHKNDCDSLSTVTELISTPRSSGRKMKLPSSGQTHRKQKHQLSHSNQLKNYIKKYEDSQVRDLAEALTRNSAIYSMIPTGDKENEICKEIKMAKSLLESSCANEINSDLVTLTTDDLLTMDAQSVAGFGKIEIPDISKRKVLSIRQPVMNSTPAKEHCTVSESTSALKSPPMRFSEIATTLRSEFEDVFGNDETSESNDSSVNIFALNGTNYTPHKVKYQSLLTDLQNSRHESTSLIESNSTDAISSSTDTVTDYTTTLTVDAGRTPYRSYKRSGVDDISSKGDLNSSFETSVSCSHYSVPIRCTGPPDMVHFMKDCLGEHNEGERCSTGPGSVETLKNMLFMLQSVSHTEDGETVETESISTCDGHSSLQKAISHLSNLKDLLG